MNFEHFFTEDNFNSYFREKLAGRSGGGVDRLSPDKFYEHYGSQIYMLVNACLEDKYRFTKYNERLILKGRNKFPRVISIPTIKDRLVLGVLNKYLQYMMPERVLHNPVNKLINIIQDYRNKNRFRPIKYLKTDFSGFYDNIDHNRLWELLETKNLDSRAIKLIKDAVKTPTINPKSSILEIPEKGIPQGLAISNILSSLYAKVHTSITFVTIILSVLILAISLLVSNMNYGERELKYYQCGLELSRMEDEIAFEMESSKMVFNLLSKKISQYHDCLSGWGINHINTDYKIAVLKEDLKQMSFEENNIKKSLCHKIRIGVHSICDVNILYWLMAIVIPALGYLLIFQWNIFASK